MAKKSLVVKAGRKQRYKTREYNRCQRCGRPRALLPQVRALPHLPARSSRTRASSPV